MPYLSVNNWQEGKVLSKSFNIVSSVSSSNFSSENFWKMSSILNINERYIKEYTDIELDITIIEIIKKDENINIVKYNNIKPNSNEIKNYEKKETNNELNNNKIILNEDNIINRSYRVYTNRQCPSCAVLLSKGKSCVKCPKYHHLIKSGKN